MASLSRIQRGSEVIDAANNNIAVSTYDPTKSILRYTTGRSSGVPSERMWTIQPTPGSETTSITISAAVATGTDDTAVWEIWEFSSGVTVEHLNQVESHGDLACAARDLSQSFLICYFLIDQADFWEDCSPSAYYVDTDTIGFRVFDETTAADFYYTIQSIEIDDASVQQVSAFLDEWSTTSNASTITSVDTTKTFVLGTSTQESSNDIDYFCTLELTNATTLTLYRYDDGNVADLWLEAFVVTMNDGTLVARYTGTATSSSATTDITITSIDQDISSAFLSSTQMDFQFGGTTIFQGGAFGDIALMSYSCSFNSNTVVRLVRTSTSFRIGRYDLQVVTFNEAAAADDRVPRPVLVDQYGPRRRSKAERDSYNRKWR